MSIRDIYNYSNGGNLYGWHISNLIIYDIPKKLSEFKHWVDSGYWSRLAPAVKATDFNSVIMKKEK